MKLIIQASAMVSGLMQYDPSTGLVAPMGDVNSKPYSIDPRQHCLVLSNPTDGEVDPTTDEQKRQLGMKMLAQFLRKAADELEQQAPNAELRPLTVMKGSDEVN